MIAVTVEYPRCGGYFRKEVCGKLLAVKVSSPWAIECPRCGFRNEG